MMHIIRRKLTQLATRFYDPLVPIQIGSITIEIPLSHQLREIIKSLPQYNFNLARIAKYLGVFFEDLRIIDIGANVGDSAAYIRNYSNASILCIDGDAKYAKVLAKNASKFTNVDVCKALVGAQTAEANVKLTSGKGTAYLEASDSGVKFRTLDNILSEFPKYKKSKLIKIDTDGYDSIILRSCRNYLEVEKPILFFEFDPHLMERNGDDAFDFIKFLTISGYKYFIFYMNSGDYILSCESGEENLLNQLIHFFSGRSLDIYADICAIPAEYENIYDSITKQEIEHFQKIRQY
jgi:FkbM family methyltransferase